jgi:hypothetical protein
MSARARREAAGREGNAAMKRGRIVVHLRADGGAALRADVVVLAAGREDQEKLLSRRRRTPAAWAEEARRVELLEAIPGTAHVGILHRGL